MGPSKNCASKRMSKKKCALGTSKNVGPQKGVPKMKTLKKVPKKLGLKKDVTKKWAENGGPRKI